MQKVQPPDPEIDWMDSKTVKLNCLTLGELENEPIFKKVECSFNGYKNKQSIWIFMKTLTAIWDIYIM